MNNLNSLFSIIPRYCPVESELLPILDKLRCHFCDILHAKEVAFLRLTKGQGINYKVSIAGSKSYILQIVSIRGYPNIDELKKCYEILDANKIEHAAIIDCDKSEKYFPFGYILQEWIDGRDAAEIFDLKNDAVKWISDFVEILKKVNKIKMPFFGDLCGNLQYHSIQSFYKDIYNVVAHSFGNILNDSCSIYELEECGIITRGFLERVLEKVYVLLDKLVGVYFPVLVYGDMLPMNLIYGNNNKKTLIDWDEARCSWKIYEIARCLFYNRNRKLLDIFIHEYDDKIIPNDYNVGISLEHIRQLLRNLFMLGFYDAKKDELRFKAKSIEQKIICATHYTNCEWLEQ